MKKRFLTYLLFLLCGLPAVANHIAGAELHYDYMGNNLYKVTLMLYRNCTNCAIDPNTGRSPCADYGDPEYVFIFDSAGRYVDAIAMRLRTPDTIPSIITNPCMTPTDICTEQALYSDTITLPRSSGGYTLVYERCCRNSLISSIPTIPNSGIGAAYVAHIPGTPNTVNSSPRFINRPPLFICVDQYLQFDNSATDPDGDSLSYALVSARDYTNSGNVFVPSPGTAIGPPYPAVPYLSPYGANNPTNSPSNSNNLSIDPTTGLLVGIPNQVGSFIVAVAVSEYRHGVYLGQTIRDYQFNVTTCNIPAANLNYQPGTYNPSTQIGVFTFECSSDTVHFDSLHVFFTNPPPTNIPLTYHWDFGLPNRTDDTSNLTYPTFYYPDTGTYLITVIITKSQTGVSGSCYDTARGYVIVFPKLKALYGYIDHCRDSAIVFLDSSYSTSSPINYWHWDFGDGDTTNIHSPTHIYNLQSTFHVKLTVKNQKGCTDTAIQSITPRALPIPDFTVSQVCVFDPLNPLYTGSGTISNYDWDFGNGAQSILPNPTVTYTTPGTFNIALTTVTPEGCRDTAIKSVTVNPLPTVGTSPNAVICPFDTTQLFASGGNSYVWSPGATLSDSAISNPRAFPGVTSTFYYVTVTDANGCKNNSFLWVQVKPLPIIDAGRDTSVCLNPGSFRDSVQLTATGGVRYVWTPTAGLSNPTIANPVSRPPTNMTYYVTGTDTNGCKLTDSVSVFYLDPALNLIVDTAKPICDFDTTTLTVLRQGYSIYTWSPNIGISDTSSNSPSFFPHGTTTYVFTVLNYCYTKKDTATIVVNPLPPLTTEHVDSVCSRDTVRLHASGADTYHWRSDPTILGSTLVADPLVAPPVTQTYYVTGTESLHGCHKDDTVLVNVFPLPIPHIGPDTAYICLGRPIQLIATGGVDYTWRSDPTLSALNVANPIATPTDTTLYYVRVFNIHQCHADDTIKVNVQMPVTAVVQSPYDFCSGVTVQLHASGGFYYLWTPGRWLSDSTLANPTAKPDTSVTYTVRVSNDCFSDVAQVVMTVRPSPTVDAGNDTTIYRNSEAILRGATNGNYYYWYPGHDIVSAFSLVTAATPIYTTSYYLYARSEYGCINVDTVVITIDPYTLIMMPTAFSPNGDGLNDVFHIVRFLNIEKLVEFKVYDRWGEKVFSTDIITDGWDGTYRGQAVGMGVYVWMIKAKTYDGEDVSRTGNITLVR